MFLMIRLFAFAFVTISSVTACSKTLIEPEIYIIDAQYRGSFYVFYGVDTGTALRLDDATRVLKIPASGVLFSAFPINNGRITSETMRFFLGDEVENRKEVLAHHGALVEDTKANRNNPDVHIMGGGFGEFGIVDVNNNSCKFQYQRFYVGTLADKLNDIGYVDLEEYYRENGLPCNTAIE